MCGDGARGRADSPAERLPTWSTMMPAPAFRSVAHQEPCHKPQGSVVNPTKAPQPRNEVTTMTTSMSDRSDLRPPDRPRRPGRDRRRPGRAWWRRSHRGPGGPAGRAARRPHRGRPGPQHRPPRLPVQPGRARPLRHRRGPSDPARPRRPAARAGPRRCGWAGSGTAGASTCCPTDRARSCAPPPSAPGRRWSRASCWPGCSRSTLRRSRTCPSASGSTSGACPPMSVDVVLAITRVATYAHSPADLSADAALSQLQGALVGVTYLDGGWQGLVDQLSALAVVGRGGCARAHVGQPRGPRPVHRRRSRGR